jgi:hypothetical protein
MIISLEKTPHHSLHSINSIINQSIRLASHKSGAVQLSGNVIMQCTRYSDEWTIDNDSYMNSKTQSGVFEFGVKITTLLASRGIGCIQNSSNATEYQEPRLAKQKCEL